MFRKLVIIATASASMMGFGVAAAQSCMSNFKSCSSVCNSHSRYAYEGCIKVCGDDLEVCLAGGKQSPAPSSAPSGLSDEYLRMHQKYYGSDSHSYREPTPARASAYRRAPTRAAASSSVGKHGDLKFILGQKGIERSRECLDMRKQSDGRFAITNSCGEKFHFSYCYNKWTPGHSGRANPLPCDKRGEPSFAGARQVAPYGKEFLHAQTDPSYFHVFAGGCPSKVRHNGKTHTFINTKKVDDRHYTCIFSNRGR